MRKISGLIVSFSFLMCTGFPVHAYDGFCRSMADIENLPPRHWCEVPQSQLVSAEKKASDFVDWNGSSSAMYSSFQRVQGVGGITRAWGGAAFDTKRNCLMVFGGGHNDYGGNEVYGFCLGSLRWSRLTDPTPFPARSGFRNSDGTPVSRHTYGGLAYIASADRFWAYDGAPDSEVGRCGVEGTWTLNLAARYSAREYSPSHWELRSRENEPNRDCDQAAAYDPTSGNVIFKSPTGTFTYNFEQDRWARVSNAGRRNASVSLAVDPERRVLVEVGGGVTAVYYISDGYSGGAVSTTGPSNIQNADDPGLVYDVRLKRIVGWSGGSTVYTYDVGNRTWSAVPAASSNLRDPGSIGTSGGVFGRFNYSPELNVYMYVDRVTKNVMLYRLTENEALKVPHPPEALRVN
jgi:hypothetical protein